MSNNTDPKIQEIKQRHANTQRELEELDMPYIPVEHQDRAILLSEIERLQTAQDKVKTELEYIAYVCLDKRCIKAAEEALSHLKG